MRRLSELPSSLIHVVSLRDTLLVDLLPSGAWFEDMMLCIVDPKAPSGVGWQRSAPKALRVLVYFVYPKAPSGVGRQRSTPKAPSGDGIPWANIGHWACGGGPIRSGFRV